MLSVPTLSQMLSVIGVALFATVVLVALTSLLVDRVRSTPKTATRNVQVPAQRQTSHKTPVSTH